MMKKSHPMIVAMTGASGSIYGLKLVRSLVEANIPVIFMISPAARLVFEKELDLELPAQESDEFLQSLFTDEIAKHVELVRYRDIAASVASGSYKTRGMIICPASMNTLAEVANGIASNLISRSADVTIKEGRKLMIAPREMPFSSIHLENMLKLSKAGVCVMPPNPGFYHKPKKIDDLVDFVVGKMLDYFDVDHKLYKRWGTVDETVEEFQTLNNYR